MEEDRFEMADAGTGWDPVGPSGAQRMVFDDYMYRGSGSEDGEGASEEGWGVNVLSCVQQLVSAAYTCQGVRGHTEILVHLVHSTLRHAASFCCW